MKRTIFLLLLGTMLHGWAQDTAYRDLSNGSVALYGHEYSYPFVITGTGNGHALSTIYIHSGCKATVILRNISLVRGDESTSQRPLFWVEGADNCSNLTPVTEVHLILEGNNYIRDARQGGAALQVDQGATVHISAIDPEDDFSGTLCFDFYENQSYSIAQGGAAIGGPDPNYTRHGRAGNTILSDGTTARTHGGNIVITSGIIVARGDNGAGIGGGAGGFYSTSSLREETFYDGRILIAGGIVDATTISDSVKIGFGCGNPRGTGLLDATAPHSSVVILPGAKTTGRTAGVRHICHFGNPDDPLVTLHTDDFAPHVPVYVDLSRSAALQASVADLAEKYDIDLVHQLVGHTDEQGQLLFHARLTESICLYTMSFSDDGRPYCSMMPPVFGGDTTLVMPCSSSLWRFHSTPSGLLLQGYGGDEADSLAYRLEVTGVADFQAWFPNGSPFTAAVADEWIRCPLRVGLEPGLYRDVLYISALQENGTRDTLRYLVEQHVAERLEVLGCDSLMVAGILCCGDTLLFDTLTGSQTTRYDDFDCHGFAHDYAPPESAGWQHIVGNVVTILPTPRRTDSLTLRAEELPYDWGGISIPMGTSTGQYVYTIPVPDGCDSIIELALTVIPLINDEPALWVPNAFTPGKEPNSLFLVKGHRVARFEMRIFDRIGREVFRAEDILQGWDGTRKGHPLMQGAYTYRILYAFDTNIQSLQTRTGTVLLLR